MSAVSGADAAGVVAFARNSVIDKCVNDGDITYSLEPSDASLGGICGTIADSTISECVNNGSVNNGTSFPSLTYGTGGIVGNVDTQASDSKSLVINCTNYADVTAYNHVGGIAGKIQKRNQVEQCENYGHVKIIMTTSGAEGPAFYGDIYGKYNELTHYRKKQYHFNSPKNYN